MFKRFVFIACVGLFFFTGRGLLYSQHAESDGMTHASVKKAEVGNKICPVSGEKLGQDGMEPVSYEYEGKIYNFCCASCIEEFKKDPQKYIKIAESEVHNQQH